MNGQFIPFNQAAVMEPAKLAALQSLANQSQMRNVFNALLGALSCPGRCYPLPTNASRAEFTPTQQSCWWIAQALLDAEATFFTPDATLGHALTFTTARWSSPEMAAYHFYPDAYHFFPELAPLDAPQANLASVRYASTGAMDPEQAATLVIACEFGRGIGLRLAGPGVPGHAKLSVAGIPAAFWQLRAEAVRYPLGWDIFLVDQDQVVGLPRTTKIFYMWD